MPRDHILSSFDAALGRMFEDLGTMATLAERSLFNSRRALVEGNIESGKSVIADDDEIDLLENEVTNHGTQLLMRFQPMASDLRQVVSAMRLCSDIERVADQAVNIARKARRIDRDIVPLYAGRLDAMYQLATALFHDSFKAHVDNNDPAARGIKERDHDLDRLNAELTDFATAEIAADPARVRDHLDMILIARHLERVGDHAKNVAENAIYAMSDEKIRHPRSAELPPVPPPAP